MYYRQTIEFLRDQLDATMDAPVPIALGILLAALIIWRVSKAYYGVRIGQLLKKLERKESMILALKAGPAAAAAAEAATAQPATVSSIGDVRARQRALLKITNAIDAAAAARRTGDPQAEGRAADAVNLALLAARSSFAMPLPAPGEPGALDTRGGAMLLELVRPALFVGDDDAARRSAEAFLLRAPERAARVATG